MSDEPKHSAARPKQRTRFKYSRRKKAKPTPPPIGFAKVYIEEGMQGVERRFDPLLGEFVLWANWPGNEDLAERRDAYLEAQGEAGGQQSP